MISPDSTSSGENIRINNRYAVELAVDSGDDHDDEDDGSTSSSSSSDESLHEDPNSDSEAAYNAFLPFIRSLSRMHHDPTPTPTPWVRIKIVYDRIKDLYRCSPACASPHQDVMSLLLGGEHCFMLHPVYQDLDGAPTGDIEFLQHRGSYMYVLGWQKIVKEVNVEALPFDAIAVYRRFGDGGEEEEGMFWIRRVSGGRIKPLSGWVNPIWSLEVSKVKEG